ncbi:hypothetical protein IWW42_001438 [Coemansia sp. RSA 1085]|nr:hypothetical protein IWW42_001438 [Coemansia sp. RSA 1085]
MDSDTEPSTPRSILEPTPESEYENRIANLDSAPSQYTTEFFSWRQLADMTAQLSELTEKYGAVTAQAIGNYVALGTESGTVVVTDYLGRAKAALAAGAYGAVSALAFSAKDHALVAGYTQGFVAVWDWVRGTTVAVSRPLLQSDDTGVGHPAGLAIGSVGFIGSSRHRFISASTVVLYHHIVQRVLTTMHTVALSEGSGVLFEAAALSDGSHTSAAEDSGLVAIMSDAQLKVVATRPKIEQVFATRFSEPAGGGQKRTVQKRAYSGSVSWLPAQRFRRAATATDPAERGHTLSKLAFAWGTRIGVLQAVDSDKDIRVEMDRVMEWEAAEDVVLCRWLDTDAVLFMTRTQRIFVLEVAQQQETEICTAPPRRIFGQPWATLATGIEAEPSYSAAVCVYRRRVFALCGGAEFVGRLLTWTERLQLLAEQHQYPTAITLAAGFALERTGHIVVGLPSTQRNKVISAYVTTLVRRALSEKAAAGTEEQRALAMACTEVSVALEDTQTLFSDVFEHYADEERLVFLEALEPFVLNGQLTRLPPQVLNALVAEYGTSLAHVRRLGDMLAALGLHPGEFDVDFVLGSCRRHRLWRTFARVWLGMGDPVAPLDAIISAATRDGESVSLVTDEEPDVVVFAYLDMVLRGRSYPSEQPIKPSERAERFATLVARYIFVPEDLSTLRALLQLGMERLLDVLRHVLGDPFIGNISIIMKPHGGDRALRRASLVKTLPQAIVDALYSLTMSPDALPPRQVGLLSSFALTLYATRFPLIYLADAAVTEWTRVLLHVDDASTRNERESAFELLVRLNPPQSYADLIGPARGAGFYRVLEHAYRMLEHYESALRTFLERPHAAQRRAVFAAMHELAAGRERAREGVSSFAVNCAVELVEVDADSFVEAVEAASIDHSCIVDALGPHPPLQMAYLRALLDPLPALRPTDERSPPDIGLSAEQHIVVYPLQQLAPDPQPTNRFPQAFHERYLELLCSHSPSGVLPYLKRHADSSPEPFRLAVVQDACRRHNVGDGLVWALLRLGDFDGALKTVLQQIDRDTEPVRKAVQGLQPEGTEADSTETNSTGKALSEPDRERLVDQLNGIQHNIDSGVRVCKTAQATLSKDAGSRLPNTEAGAAEYRSQVSLQLCDLWLALLRCALGHLHATNRTLLPSGVSSNAAAMLVSKRQRWMLQSVLDALIFAASSASSFISLRSIIQQLLDTADVKASPHAARSLEIAEVQHLLAVSVNAYKSEAQLMALTNVLVDYDLFSKFALLVRSQKQGWRVVDAQPSAHSLSVACDKCHDPLFADSRQDRALADLRAQMSEYYEGSTLRVLDLHVFEDRSTQWQWMKLRSSFAANSTYSVRSRRNSIAREQVVLFKCGHCFHRRCSPALAAGQLPECKLCAKEP